MWQLNLFSLAPLINNVTVIKQTTIILQFGRAPIHLASFRGNAKCIETLIKAGADVNGVDNVSYYQAP